MDEFIQVEEKFYILATSPRASDGTSVLKHGESFAVLDAFGDVEPLGHGEEGLYHEGTRHLSRLHVRLNGKRPLLLSSTVRDDNALLDVNLTNPDITEHEYLVLPRDTLHVLRVGFLRDESLFFRFRVHNYALAPVDVSLSVTFAADFADIFEVRGMKRERRGRLLSPRQGQSAVELGYEGLDGVERWSRIEFDPKPSVIGDSMASFETTIPSHGDRTFHVAVRCLQRSGQPVLAQASEFDDVLARVVSDRARTIANIPRIHTSNEQLNDWIARSSADLHMMISETEHGPYPYAGVPWYSTPFGRDGIITAFEYLWIDPGLARGVLRFLAATQAKETEPERNAEPGKIFHEIRRGEMAALGEIPFGRYYGSADATPLFVVLADAHHERTADDAFAETMWPHVERALRWIDAYADPDGDGFFEYASHSKGLVSQGWKDSFDSVFHADGRLAEAPVALCEVQGYVFAAWRAAARLASRLGRVGRAQELTQRAEELRVAFEDAFWDEELGTYILALDGEKRPCRVRASNAGHALFAGIASTERAGRVAERLLDEANFSGWGIRTVASSESRYNPMAYHNGSIWPHDNAIVAQGFARYGLKNEALKVFEALFEASALMEIHRMPELFCGFTRRPGQGPVHYPVACAPQSWAAGAVFLLLQSCLGLSIDAAAKRLCFERPILPASVRAVHIENLSIGNATVDLELRRHARDVGINLTRRTGPVDVIVVK
ncbi:MAG: amylo-alpha-1,6-glucosidase [Planctomycetota bacterium]